MLPKEVQSNLDEKLSLFLENMFHPSIRAKRIQGTKNRWEGSVTMNYRFTFELVENTVIFRTIGTHDILRK
jgi:mRNA interferase RelE/StbE